MQPEITFDGGEPKEKGYYLYRGQLSGIVELVHIVPDGKGDLINTTGRTHFSRWLVDWSRKLNLGP